MNFTANHESPSGIPIDKVYGDWMPKSVERRIAGDKKREDVAKQVASQHDRRVGADSARRGKLIKAVDQANSSYYYRLPAAYQPPHSQSFPRTDQFIHR